LEVTGQTIGLLGSTMRLKLSNDSTQPDGFNTTTGYNDGLFKGWANE
jgi:hypothetical protein